MGEEGSEVQGELVNPVGRRECLDALHQAWKLQAVLQELLVWARRLRAEMDAPRAPSSPAEARHMLEEHQQRKVSGGTWAFPGISPLPCPLPYWGPLFLCRLPLPFYSSIAPLQLSSTLSSSPLGLLSPTERASASGS